MAVELQDRQDRQTLYQRAEARAHLLTRWCQRSCRYFVEQYIYIEDRDDAALAIPFRLWPKQVEALAAFLTHRLVICLKARQLGLTWLALAYALWLMLFHPGKQVIALSRRESDAKELVRRMEFMLRHLPEWMVRPRARVHPGYDGPIWEATVTTLTIYHPDGEPSLFRSLPSAPDSGRSLTANLLLLDEWAIQQWARRIWDAAYPAVNRPTGGQVIGVSTGRQGTLFAEIWDDAVAGVNGFHPVFLPWHADPRRTREWYEATKRAQPHTYRSEYPATPEDAFTVGEGAAFTEWDATVHVVFGPDWYPPAGWRLVRAYDGGWNRACCKWYAIDPDGNAVCYREYYPSQVTDAEQARTIVALSKDPSGASEDISYTVADPACWGTSSSTGESTAEVFRKNGVPMRPADNDRINGWKRLHMWLAHYEDPKTGEMTARLRFTEACKHTIRTYPGIPASETKPDDVDTTAEDHAADCDRYFVMSRPAPPLSEEEAKRRTARRARYLRPKVSHITGY